MSSNSSTMTGDSLEVGSRWGPERREMEREKIWQERAARGDRKADKLECRFLPANLDPCSLGEEEGERKTDLVLLGRGENHVARGVQ